ncbi:UDP-N-acetylglucosamine 1-carboxyvinyltransferase [Candidatus Daviesbacteria bacterium]|nr:UDP-N-acetylglucosamine 1-carboxyvinyltransferase [Candidatus Daviesbacteria bacterium]
MARYIINGGQKLSGSIQVSGNKNAILPCIAACLLTDQDITLENVPQIADVKVLLQILEELGVKVEKGEHNLKLNAKEVKGSKLPKQLTSKLRASILLVGPMLSRAGKAEFTHPGGDIIGKRTIEPHLTGFRKLGFSIESEDRDYRAYRIDDLKVGLVNIFLDEASCTATENLIMASVLGKSSVILKNCAKEPQIVDLCNLLNLMGAQISGVGEATLKIIGVDKLRGAEYRISSDYIEWVTYAIASSITGGQIEIQNATLKDMEPVTVAMEKMGINLREENNSIQVSCNKIIAHPKLHTNIWPGFPTDLMSVFIVLATQADGVSLMHDWMYESRMFFADKLISMGANITIADPHRVVIYGPTKLHGRELETPDIRAGMALVLAALVAQGESIIHRAQLIERGYENVVENLSSLGAKIQKVD